MRELQALVRRLESLIEMRVAEENRLAAGITVALVRSSVEEMIAHLKDQITRTEKLIRKHIDKHPGLKQQSELLNSIPGIADTTAALLLAEVPNLKQYRSARQVAAFAGLVPRERQSGSSVKGRVRLSKIGNARLRKALYFPAITALRCSPFFQTGQRFAAKRQEQDECDWGGDAQAHSYRLRSVEVRTTFRSGVSEICLTLNTVSQLRRAISIRAEGKRLLEKHAIAPSAARLC